MQVVESRCARGNDAPWLLAQLFHTLFVCLCGDKMQMAQLRHGMAQGIVDRAIGHLTTMNVCDRYCEWQGRYSRCIHLESVTEYHQNIGSTSSKRLGKSNHSQTYGF